MTAGCRVVVVLILLSAAVTAAVSGGMARAQGTETACGMHARITQQASGGVWVYSRPNPFDDSGQQLCISGSTSRPGFTILNNLRYTGAWQAYPFTGAGCAFNLCSRRTPLPMQLRGLPTSANTSFAWTGSSAPGNWNASYDIWIDRRNQTTAQDDGAELMIWLRPNPGYHRGVRVHINRRTYWFVHWRTCNSIRQTGITPPRASPNDHAGICWNYVQFRFLHVVHSVRRLWIVPFIQYLEKQGLVRPTWYMTSVHAGYELVSGGKGLTTTSFGLDTKSWSTRQASEAAARASGTVDVLYKSAGATLGHQWFGRRGWGGPASMGSRVVSGEPSVVTSFPSTVDAFWQGADRGLWHQFTGGHGWSSQQAMHVGALGGPPKAVAQPDGSEDVFWRGTDNHLWYVTYTRCCGWSTRHDLGGDLASNPAPAASSPGTFDVFWRGADGNLWHVHQARGQSWSAPANLNVGTLGGPPAATGQLNGAVDVFWHGSGDDHLWHASYLPGAGWSHGAQDLGGDLASSTAPVAPVTSGPSTVDVFWEGTDGNLWHAFTNGHGWQAPSSLGMGPLGSMPFAAAQPNGHEDVFWRGAADHHLWHAYYSSGQGWHGPQDLGGDLYPMP